MGFAAATTGDTELVTINEMGIIGGYNVLAYVVHWAQAHCIY